MADEQIIYISPEEELTNVRERLEHTAARRIILVIPPQTQLRSHVGWRLLHARTREMGKDVVINSSDRQIRAVAKAAGFRVADSLESPTTGKSRPASRPGRNAAGGRASSRQRTLFGRGTSENRPTTQRGNSPRSYTPSNARPLSQLSPQTPRTEINRTPTERDSMISPDEEISSEAGSSTFGSRNNPYGQDFEYRIDTAPSIHPLSPPFEDEEPDLLIDDFKQAQNIRQAAQMGNADNASKEPQEDVINSAPMPGDLHDPLAYREDFPPMSLPEQHASVPMDELDSDIPDIGDVPTSIFVDGEIEDLGDEGDIVDPYASSPRSWSEPPLEEEDGIDSDSIPDDGAQFIAPSTEPPRTYGTRNGRQGNVPPTPYEGIEDEDTLLPPEQPIRPAFPTRGGLPPITVGNRPPQPIITPQSRPSDSTPVARPTPAAAKQSPASIRSRTVRPPATARPVRPAPRRRNARGTLFILTTIILILLILGILFILIPAATITVTLPSQVYSSATPLKVTATSTSREDITKHVVPAQQLTFNKTVGPLSGTVQLGGQASGYAAFTNNGTQALDIPLHTVVETKSGLQFQTQGDVVVPHASTFPAVQIIALNPGTAGNVPAGTITVIPQSSIQAIAGYNNVSSSSVNLTVTNTTSTTGGQAGSTGNGTTNATTALKQKLHQQMQTAFNNWLKDQLHGQDVASKPTPDIHDSSTPLPQENFAIGTPAADGNFSGTDTLQATVLVVRTADLQTVARAEFNAALASTKQYAGDALIPQSSLTLSKITSSTSSDGKTLTISFVPKGLIGQNVSNAQLENLRGLLAGRKVTDAKSFLMSSASGLKNVINSQVSLSPGFTSTIPFWTARIHISVQYHCTGKNCSTG
jgi:uncharacterized integral membrane protein